MAALSAVLGRILLGAYFIITGGLTILAPETAGALFSGAGWPPQIATVAGVFEVLGGLCLALGALTRLVALTLAIWLGLGILLFRPLVISAGLRPDVLMQLGLIGGLLLVFAHSQVWWSLDAMRHTARADRARLVAEERAHDAEVRADRAAVAGTPVRRRWF
jgi:putative oxidoreductase